MAEQKSSDFKEYEDENLKKFGFDLYPERRFVQKDLTFFDKINQINCEKNVLSAIKTNPLIKLLLGALKNMGCPVDLKRNIVCENCDSQVAGGFDQEFNQIVICKNRSANAEAVLIHELIHMYDYCTSEIDFKNLEHLACTEIRAANIAHCSFLSSVLSKQSSFINIKKTHRDCVKMKAAQSMMISRNLPFEEVMQYVNKVFDKCYNDLEPIGRRLRKNSSDLDMALNEAIQIGICSP